jgi:hypothetical protein
MREQVELGGREVHGVVVPADAASGEVERHSGDVQRLVRLGGRRAGARRGEAARHSRDELAG